MAVVEKNQVVHKLNREQLERSLMLLFKTCEDGERPIPAMVYSDPGLGKTETVYRAYDKTKEKMGDAMLPLLEKELGLMDAVDIACPMAVNGKLEYAYQEWVPFHDKIKDKWCWILLDEFDRSQKDVQNLSQKMVLSKNLDGHRLSDNAFYIACCNGESDESFTTEISEATKSRWCHINLSSYGEADEQEWQDWAYDHDVCAEVRTFAKYGSAYNAPTTPFKERAVCNYRTRRQADRILKASKRCSFRTDDIILPLLAGVLGSEAASALFATNDLLKGCPSPEEIIRDPENTDVPSSPKSCFALGSLLMNHVEMNKPAQVRAMLKYMVKFPKEITGGFFRNIGYKHPSITSYDDYKKWCVDNSFLL